MEETCNEGRTNWEEIYWTRFKFIHFIQNLHAGFDRQLAIPEDFARNFRKKLAAETVCLKGPSGHKWSVGITEENGTLLFKDGWPQFVEDHSLKQNDTLFFKYNVDSFFDVLVFNSKNKCEIPATYFIQKRAPAAPADHTLTTECQRKRKNREGSVEGHFTASHTHSGDKDSPPEKITCFDTVRERTAAATSSQRPRRGRPRIFKTRPDSNDSDAGDPCFNRSGSFHNAQYASGRRHVTQDEIDKALELANAASTPEDLVVVMRPTHIYRRFFMTINQWWSRKHLSFKTQEIILRSNGKIWPVNFYISKTRGTGGLQGGWMRFSLENNLEEGDVCVFKLEKPITKPCILDVTIFRVVDQIVPLTRVPGSSSTTMRKT